MANHQERVEQLIDELSVKQVFQLIEDICQSKAEHIRENWQDHELAEEWDKTATLMMQVADAINV